MESIGGRVFEEYKTTGIVTSTIKGLKKERWMG